MMIDVQGFMVAQTILNVILVASLVVAEFRLKKYERDIRLMTANDKTVPTDPLLIEEWAQTMARLEEGCPKWCAYRDRLTSLGYFTEEAVVARRARKDI